MLNILLDVITNSGAKFNIFKQFIIAIEEFYISAFYLFVFKLICSPFERKEYRFIILSKRNCRAYYVHLGIILGIHCDASDRVLVAGGADNELRAKKFNCGLHWRLVVASLLESRVIDPHDFELVDTETAAFPVENHYLIALGEFCIAPSIVLGPSDSGIWTEEDVFLADFLLHFELLAIPLYQMRAKDFFGAKIHHF